MPNRDHKNDVAALLREAREASGFTQAEMAKRVGVDSQTVSRWERGESRISAEDRDRFLVEAAKGLGKYVPRGTSPVGRSVVREEGVPFGRPRLADDLEARARQFEREATRDGATDADLDFIEAILRHPNTVRLFTTGEDGQPLSREDRLREMEMLLDALRTWIGRRIAARRGTVTPGSDHKADNPAAPVIDPSRDRKLTDEELDRADQAAAKESARRTANARTQGRQAGRGHRPK